MPWIWLRVLLALTLAVGGGLLGHLLGGAWGYALQAALTGALLGVGLLFSLDMLRGHRILRWLAESLNGPPPAFAGFWGELAARIERALRARERTADAERERLAQFLSAIEASPNGVLLLDASEQIEWCNQPAAEHLGLDRQRDLRQRVTNLVRAPAFVAMLQARAFDQPVQIPQPGGRGLLSIIVRPYGDGQRLVLTQDITERERADAMRRDFVANVSHEIRTPLTVVAGFVETLTNLPLSEVERKRVLALMAQQTQRMQSLVGDLLTLARLEGSPRPPADTWVPLARLSSAVELDARSLSAGRHRLAFDWGDGVELAGSEPELLSAVTNLVSNAVRYTPESGQIEVVWRRRAEGAGEIVVRDTGPGIAAEHLTRLTERFYRVDGSRSRDTGGTGLGLAIVKHVVQRHGGELLIESTPGVGSCFTLVLPASRVRAPATRLALQP
ncbi:phosphate regulon sensor histidine kinase PhoR [Ideonella sp.]|uniref:phosphate regulon sensor histidine kinase PhoR n=1 Tax=Ideonella sp. TaxID=1929293 RepID=UPI002B489C5B|nr:phosphate regulon sensor histidine kinase PhoR [Ideonella sp.]HJV69762.1 phosphate regulon sensor histidine kinase PhoR [Ideonella sp.]